MTPRERREAEGRVYRAMLEYLSSQPACRRCKTTSFVEADHATMQSAEECASCAAWGAAVVSEPVQTGGPFARWAEALRAHQRWLATPAGMYVEDRR